MRYLTGLLGGFIALTALLGTAAGQPIAAQGRRLALLVGVSKYDHLPEAYQLTGPGNDVDSIAQVLEHRGFATSDIATLCESHRPTTDRPSRANILRELDRLATHAAAGDWVVIFIAGHGSREPKAASAASYEVNPYATTGLFLPCDVQPADASGGLANVGNAIQDHEFSDRIKLVLEKGAWVWLIDDSCHSGGLVRGADDVYREVPPTALGLSEEAVRKADQVDAQRNADRAREAASAIHSGVSHVIDSSRFVAMYACRRFEPTMEMPLPSEPTGPTPAVRHGLFTYCLCRAIESAQAPVTFAELITRVHLAYDAQGRSGTPYPIVEGKARDNLMFSGDTRRTGIRLSRSNSGWTVNAGLLGSLNRDSVMAIFPPEALDTTGAPAGYVKVDSADLFTARVSPVAYDILPAPAHLAAGSLCKTVFYDFGPDPQRVSVEAISADPNDEQSVAAVAAGASTASIDPAVVQAATSVRADLQAFTTKCPLAVIVDAHANPRPQWRVVVYRKGADVRTSLICVASGVTFRAPADKDRAAWVNDALSKISRGENLLKIAGAASTVAGDSNGLRVSLELTVTSKGGGPPRVVDPTAGRLVLHEGDGVRFRIRNDADLNSGRQVDVTLLFLDSDYAIIPLYPRAGTVGDNRIGPGKYREYTDTIQADTIGTERVLLIAQEVVNSPVPTDFDWLEEIGIAKDSTRGAAPAAEDELARLLLRSHFQTGGPATRGLLRGSASRTFMRVLSWDTQK